MLCQLTVQHSRIIALGKTGKRKGISICCSDSIHSPQIAEYFAKIITNTELRALPLTLKLSSLHFNINNLLK